VLQIVKGDKAAQENLPKVMKDKLKANANAAPKGSRSYSTMTTQTGTSGLDMGLVDVQSASKVPLAPGLKFEMPSLPLPKDGHVKHRYDPVVEQVTNLLMRDGEKSVAQTVSFTSPCATNNGLIPDAEYGSYPPAPAHIANSYHQPSEAPPAGCPAPFTSTS
jgi:hypothetical protein